jgi:hypothetical protein
MITEVLHCALSTPAISTPAISIPEAEGAS